MDISVKEMKSKLVRLWKDIMFIQCRISLKGPYRPYTSRISYRVPKHIFFSGERGAYLKGGGAYYKFWALGGALNRNGALIWSWALIRAYTVIKFDFDCKF